jgi:uncharacterized membrane protein YccC
MKAMALRLTEPDIGAVARSLLGVLIVAAVALYWGPPAAAVSSAGAAAIAGAVALQDSPRGRLAIVAAVSAEMGLAVLLGTLTSAYSALFIGVVAVWCLAAGMQWALGANAGLTAAAASALLVTVPPSAPTFSVVTESTALTIAGGLTQAALIAAWPQRRWRVQNDALGRAYRALASDARNLATNPDAQVDPAPLLALREAVTLSDSQARRRPLAYRGWYGLPERITVTLSALSRREKDRDAISGVLTAAADVLDAVADRGRTARRVAEAALGRTDVAVAAVTGAEAAAAQRLSKQLYEAAALRFGTLSPASAQVGQLRELTRSSGEAVRGHLTQTSPILRHAVRLCSAAAVGTAVARLGGVEHGYWIPLTVLMVMRPETAHTYTRCVARVAGTAAGIVVASAVTMLWHPTGLVSAALAVVFLAVAYAVYGLGYIALSAAVAAAIVFLIDINAVADAATMKQRLLATVIGGALAVVAHAALPDHALIRLRQRAGELLKTEIDYAATVINAFVHQLDDSGDAPSAAWQRAFRARAAFEAASGGARVNSRELRRWLRSFRTALNAVTSACVTLETSLSGYPSSSLSSEFVAAVDDYVEALRGDPPTPAAPWNLDFARLTAAHQRVREAAALLAREDHAARVLVAEIGSITRSLSGIAIDVIQS